jgi:hypothetical protein
MARPESMGVAAISLAQSFGFFQSYMPPIAEVRKAHPSNPEAVGDVRIGETAALVGSLAVGAIIAWITGDPTPVYVSFMVCAVMVAVYEMTLRASRPMEGTA